MSVTARSITLCILVSLMLVACGSSPPVRYYTLSTVGSAPGQNADDAIILGFGPLGIPEYLNRSQIVTRGAGAEMLVDEYSRWAEPLGLSLHRVVSTNVDNLLDAAVVVAFPYDSVIRAQVNYRLLGDVSRFDADRSGQVVLELQWVISEVSLGIVVPPRRSRYEAQAARAGDPAAIAAAMNEALYLFSQDIASELAAVL